MNRFYSVMGSGMLLCGLVFAQDAPAAKNIILFIGDGMGYNHVLAGNYYQQGAAGKQAFEQWTHVGTSTYDYRGSYDPDRHDDYEYLQDKPNDSAATATAMASGEITYRGSIGMNVDKEPMRLITEHAEDLGKATGVVSSVLFCHATPAAFLAHTRSRQRYADISTEMILESGAEVIMGAGHPEYDEDGTHVGGHDGDPSLNVASSYERLGGKEIYAGLQNGTIGGDADGDGEDDAWTFIDSRAAFKKLAEGDTPKRVFGLAPIDGTLQANRGGDRLADAFEVPLVEPAPTLTEMTIAALNVLDNDPDGFFLMVEGGAIDWASHANELGRMVEEQVAFFDTIQTVIDWVEANSSWAETLVIVTADHECGFLLGPGSNPDLKPIVNNGKGKMPGMEWHTGGHTNQLIPTYLKGPGADRLITYKEGVDPARGPYVHDAAIGKLMFEVLK